MAEEKKEDIDSKDDDIFKEDKSEEGDKKPEDIEKKSEESEEKKPDDLEAKNRQLFERTKKAEEKAQKALEEVERLKKSGVKPGLEVDEYIDISASLEGLDAKEKKKLAAEAKLTGKALSDIRSSEDFSLWQKAYREKVEKEKALDPSNRQVESKKPKTFEEEVDSTKDQSNPFAITQERESLLEKKCLWKAPQVRKPKDTIPLS